MEGARLANPDTEGPTERSADDEAGRDLAMDDKTPGVAHGREAEAVDTWLHGLTEQCRERMVEVAMRENHGRDGAEGIAQRALVVALNKALQDPDLIATIDHPCAWLIAITRNVARDIRGRELRQARIRRENAERIREVLFPQSDHDWDVDRLCKRVLDMAASALNGRRFEVVRCMVDGMPDAEIAEMLGISRVTVRVHRRNALRVIKGSLGRRAHPFAGGVAGDD